MTEPVTRKIKDLTLLGDIQAGDKVVGERTDGTTVRFTFVSSGGGGAVDSVNGQTGTVVLASDNISDTAQTHKFTTVADAVRLANTSGTNTGDQTISLTGDVTGSGTGSFATTIANGAVTLAKQADMATASVVYRKTAGSGSPEVQTLATLKTDLGLTGTNSGDQTITLTGDVTGSGTSSFAATIAARAVSYAKMQAMATGKLLGRNTAGSGDIEEITDIPTAVTVGGQYNYRASGTDVSLADGGTGASLSDPNADRIMFWDDSAGSVDWLTAGTGLKITTTTLSVNANSFRATQSAPQTISASTITKLTFNTETWDTGSNYDNATNYRFTPTIAGKYRANVICGFTALGSGKTLAVYIYKNGSSYIFTQAAAGGAAGNSIFEVCDVIDMNGSTDYIEGYVIHNDSVSRDTLGASFSAELTE